MPEKKDDFNELMYSQGAGIINGLNIMAKLLTDKRIVTPLWEIIHEIRKNSDLTQDDCLRDIQYAMAFIAEINDRAAAAGIKPDIEIEKP